MVSRRFRDSDPVARTATEVLERASNYCLDEFNFDSTMRQVRDDFLLYGRGTCWLRYQPEFGKREVEHDTLQDLGSGADPEQPDDRKASGERYDDDVEVLDKGYEAPETEEFLKAERIAFDYVHRDDFLHSPARTWSEVWWVARKVFLTRAELIDRFGEEKGKLVGLDHVPPGIKKDTQNRETVCKATVYEIWSKRDRKVYFVSEGYDGILAEEDPFLDLKGFFPCPEPVYGTKTNDSLIPTPDYKLYQDQAEEIDAATAKIASMTEALKLSGFYPAGASNDASASITQAIATADLEVTLIPAADWSGFQNGGGANQIQWIPLGEVVGALRAAYDQRSALISDVYQITGISDIMRGESVASETATAQSLKQRYGSIRLRDRQLALQRFANDIIVIMAEAIAEKFEPSTLEEMSGVPLGKADEVTDEMLQQAQAMGQDVSPVLQLKEVIELIRNDRLRGFRIEVASDSMSIDAENEDKQLRLEFLQAVTGFMQTAASAPPQLIPLAGEMLKFGVRGFRIGRELEDTIEKTVEQLAQAAQQQPEQAPQGPNPAEIEAQRLEARGQYEQQKAAIQLQGLQARTEADVIKAGLTVQKAQTQAQIDAAKAGTEIERMQTAAAFAEIDAMNRRARNF